VSKSEGDKFSEFGYVVLQRFFDPGPLIAELEHAIGEGITPGQPAQRFPAGSGTVSLQYVPMMCERTPVSLDLAGALASVAEELLQRRVLPGRAKGTRYFGDTSWHRDSELEIASLGCLAYLDRVTASTGALQILPFSHTDRTVELPEAGWRGAVAIESAPGDVIVFDEHLVHGSRGGRERRQWRTDFVIDPAGSEITAALEWFAQSVPDKRRDPGYQARLYPSYGEYWRSRYATWAARLAELGTLDQWALC
jgi:hypothetical protein